MFSSSISGSLAEIGARDRNATFTRRAARQRKLHTNHREVTGISDVMPGPAALLRLSPLLLVVACGNELVRVVPDGVPPQDTNLSADPTFQVVARVAGGAHDPLAVSGADVAFSDLATALGQAVVRAVAPRHDSVLTVELIADDAKYRNGRLAVSLVARATLRTNHDNTFIGQTEVVCRDGAIVAADHGARVMWSCMTHLGHDLGGWLESVAR
jgi:hypothetical protein